MKDENTEKDEVTFDSSEFESKKGHKQPDGEGDDVVSMNDEDSRELSPEVFKKLQEKLKTALAQKQEYLDGWQRAKADFVNFKKTKRRGKKGFYKIRQ